MNKQVLSIDNYSLSLGSDIFYSELNPYINQDYICIIDQNVHTLYKDKLNKLLSNAQNVIIIQALESNKNAYYLNKLYDCFHTHKVTRSTPIIIIGGGLILDLSGYACATYNRGLKMIYVPTTLLSMVDSSIGGKVAINKYNLKNIIGTFYNPSHVIIDINFLNTLSTRLFKEGLVELLKHAFIYDPSILQALDPIKDIFALRENTLLLQDIIYQSLLVKKHFITLDYHDHGIRNTLNFGHSFAHALEMSHPDYYHGECVAIGMLVSACLNNKENLILSFLEKFEVLRPLEDVNYDKVFYDKKRNQESINEILLDNLGQTSIHTYDIDTLINLYKRIYDNLKTSILTHKAVFEIKNKPLKGSISMPPSKSYLHRYIMMAFLHGKHVVLNNVTELNEDVLTTLKVLKTFNLDYTYEDHTLTLDTSNLLKQDHIHVNMHESGTSLRLMLPWLNYFAKKVTIHGQGKLGQRPLQAYIDLFEQHDILYQLNDNDSFLPLSIFNKLEASHYTINASRSSQFVSGLLLLMSIANKQVTLTIQGQVTSLPYIQMTIKVLNDFGIQVQVNEDYTQYTINHSYQRIAKELSFDIEQDYSSRAFFEVANSFEENQIIIENPIEATLQEDASIIQTILSKDSSFTLTNKPDCGPIMALYYANKGGTLKDVNRLIYKESNRLQAIIDLLDVSGATYTLKDNHLSIQASTLSGGYFNTHKDHRIAMTLLIASTLTKTPIYIDEIQSINKSFPSFIDKFLQLGGQVDEI